MRVWMVFQLVSIPPSQRWVTKYSPQRRASSAMVSWACFLVPTKRTGRGLSTWFSQTRRFSKSYCPFTTDLMKL